MAIVMEGVKRYRLRVLDDDNGGGGCRTILFTHNLIYFLVL